MFDLFTKLEEASRFWLLPLHSTTVPEEQDLIFFPPPHGRRKVILATNVAESSITVPDVTHVLDFGLIKEIYYDARTSLVRSFFLKRYSPP